MRADIKGYEGLYQADSNGYIIKLSRPQKCKSAKYGEYTKEVVLKPYYTKMKNGSKGYAVVALSKNNVSKKVTVHRTVYQAFHPEMDENLVVDHINGNKHDNRLENLEACTHSENSIRAFDQNLMKKEFDRSFCKTNLEQFKILFECIKRGDYNTLAERNAGIPRGTICQMIRGNSYKSLYSDLQEALTVREKLKENTEVSKESKESLPL
jgi:hypothetical protein